MSVPTSLVEASRSPATQPKGLGDLYFALIRIVGPTRWFAWIGSHILTRVDRWLYPRFHGHLVSAGPPVVPLLQITTVGRRSGKPRSTPLVYLQHGDDLVVVGSNWGQARHPDWSTNLLAQPVAEVDIKGVSRRVVARLATPAQQAELWPRLVSFYPGYQAYKDYSGREERVFILSSLAER